MKLLLTVVLLSVSAVSLSACFTHGNGVGNGGCPPGQAKKGNCVPHHHHHD